MENFTRPHEFVKNCTLSGEDEKERVNDFVCKHFKEVTDGPHTNEEESWNDHGNSAKDKLTARSCVKIQQRAVFSGKILSFRCSLCKDSLTFSPNDLLKHFRAIHRGTLPTYPCDLCDFVTNEFPVLQRHRLEHRNTLVTCELCNDNIQYSLLLLTRHYMMCHSINGLFKCDWCEFTTVDAGTFVQHIHHHNETPWKCLKCKHISLNEEDHQTHAMAHSGTFPFTCQICGYGAARNELLKKHTAAVHKEKVEIIKITEDGGSSQETQRMEKLNYLSGNVPNHNGRIIKHELSSEEAEFLDMTVVKKDNTNLSRGFQNTEPSGPVMLQAEDNPSSDIESHGNANGLTVLMVKNKISLPPNCTTKVMGFKMVDGKKHLVLKVIPTTKQDLPAHNHSIADSDSSLVPNPVIAESKVPAENGQFFDCKSSTSQCSTDSPNIQMDHRSTLAVKVKIEEEETSLRNHDSTQHVHNVSEQTNLFPKKSLTRASTLCPVTNELNNVCNQNQVEEQTCTGGDECDKSSVTSTFKLNATSHRSKIINGATVYADNVTSLSCPLNVAQKALLSDKSVENCRTINELALTDCNDEVSKEKNVFNVIDMDKTHFPSQVTPDRNRTDIIEKEKDQQNVKQLKPPSQTFSDSSSAGASFTGKSTQNTLSQEVFSFHNYSKEMFSTSPSTNQNSDSDSYYSGHKENTGESSQFSLTLAESPIDFAESLCGEVEVDECVTSIDDFLTEENSESVFQDFNIIKVEEDSIPISSNLPETKSNSTSIGNLTKEHSKAAVSQLNKERTGLLSASNDSLKQTTNTLQILQLPEGKQPVILKATEKKFAMPVQVKAIPGFKLITSSSDPKINLSYMKQGFDKSNKTTGVTLSPNTKIISIPSAKQRSTENRTTLFSAAQPGIGATSSHYLINSQGFTRPVILSSTLQSTSADKTPKTQSTCYFVQRSVPFVQKPSVKLGSTQLSVKSQPVLAMPVNSAGKSNVPQTGCQAFLLRYISPPKSELFLNNQQAKTGTLHSQTNESPGNKVILKIVTPSGGLLSSGASTTTRQPLFLATGPQKQCFLVSQKKMNATASSGLTNLISTQNDPQKNVKKSDVSRFYGKLQPCAAERLVLAPRPVRPPSQRKRHRKALFDDLSPTVHKAQRLSGKIQTEKEIVLWKPVAKEVERTLRLAPFSSVQQVKCPRRYQPVVVLNHPDADIPEVANIMKAVNKYKGAVSKVSLSQKTVQALSDFTHLEVNSSTRSASANDNDTRPRALQSSVKERFLLKMKLRKKSKKKYKIVKTLSACGQGSAVFDCWFCGRLFNNQEDWIGHGQRHLMEATRDWNKLL